MNYIDAAGHQYRAAGRVPYSELTPGTPFAMPGEVKVCFRGTAGPHSHRALERALPGIAVGLYNLRVVLLERVEGQ